MVIPIASDSGYLAYCGWCAHYVPVPEAFARSPRSIGYVCPAGQARRDRHPTLPLCVTGCAHTIPTGLTSQGIRQRHPEDCPACGEPQFGRNRVVVLDDQYQHVTCGACGHTWLYGTSQEGPN